MDVTYCAPAKLNLFFEVCHRRSDGYHEIDSLVVPISLEDELVFHAVDSSDERPTIRLESTDATLPCDERNLVVRAIHRYRQRSQRCCSGRYGCSGQYDCLEQDVPQTRGVAAWTIHLTKRIPMEAGLGGGSSDAAVTLLAADDYARDYARRHDLEYMAPSDAEWVALGAELGSDVPLFFSGGAVRCRGRGEILEKIVDPPTPLHFVLIKPSKGLSTAMVYRNCTPGDQSGDLRSIEPFLSAFATGDPERIGRALFNRLSTVALRESSSVRAIFERLSRETTCGFGMSGSGTCCFALCRDANHATDLAKHLADTPWWIRTAYTKCGKIFGKKG